MDRFDRGSLMCTGVSRLRFIFSVFHVSARTSQLPPAAIAVQLGDPLGTENASFFNPPTPRTAVSEGTEALCLIIAQQDQFPRIFGASP
jgi:hypothetical protein